MKEKLSKIKNVDVIYVENCDADELKSIANAFVESTEELDGIIIFFAGHACVYNNFHRLLSKNWDGEVSSIPECSLQLLSLRQRLVIYAFVVSVLVLTLHCVSGDFHSLEQKGASINVVILDCCREFMFAPSPTRGGERKRLNSSGTGVYDSKRLNSHGTCVYGSIIAFPCGPNDTVSDNGRRPLIQPKH